MIGVFDSGVGGLTVARALSEAVPGVTLLYLGDTARVPYGSKSADTVARYSRMAARFLTDRGVEMLVVACNTASAYALEALKAELPIPVLGVIEPGARAAAAATRSGQIGVIGTLGTVRSRAYERAIGAVNPALGVTAHACPLLVPLAEEGWIGDDPIAAQVVRRYLEELRARAADLDVLVLGCTHYPLLRPLIGRIAAEIFGRPITLIDSADAIATAVKQARRPTPDAGASRLQCYVTDEARIGEIGERFFGRSLGTVERVDL
jgi:glutamate racemase